MYKVTFKVLSRDDRKEYEKTVYFDDHFDQFIRPPLQEVEKKEFIKIMSLALVQNNTAIPVLYVPRLYGTKIAGERIKTYTVSVVDPDYAFAPREIIIDKQIYNPEYLSFRMRDYTVISVPNTNNTPDPLLPLSGLPDELTQHKEMVTIYGETSLKKLRASFTNNLREANFIAEEAPVSSAVSEPVRIHIDHDNFATHLDELEKRFQLTPVPPETTGRLTKLYKTLEDERQQFETLFENKEKDIDKAVIEQLDGISTITHDAQINLHNREELKDFNGYKLKRLAKLTTQYREKKKEFKQLQETSKKINLQEVLQSRFASRDFGNDFFDESYVKKCIIASIQKAARTYVAAIWGAKKATPHTPEAVNYKKTKCEHLNRKFLGIATVNEFGEVEDTDAESLLQLPNKEFVEKIQMLLTNTHTSRIRLSTALTHLQTELNQLREKLKQELRFDAFELTIPLLSSNKITFSLSNRLNDKAKIPSKEVQEKLLETFEVNTTAEQQKTPAEQQKDMIDKLSAQLEHDFKTLATSYEKAKSDIHFYQQAILKKIEFDKLHAEMAEQKMSICLSDTYAKIATHIATLKTKMDDKHPLRQVLAQIETEVEQSKPVIDGIYDDEIKNKSTAFNKVMKDIDIKTLLTDVDTKIPLTNNDIEALQTLIDSTKTLHKTLETDENVKRVSDLQSQLAHCVDIFNLHDQLKATPTINPLNVVQQIDKALIAKLKTDKETNVKIVKETQEKIEGLKRNLPKQFKDPTLKQSIEADLNEKNAVLVKQLRRVENTYRINSTKLLCQVFVNAIMNLTEWEKIAKFMQRTSVREKQKHQVPTSIAELIKIVQIPAFAGWESNPNKAYSLLNTLQLYVKAHEEKATQPETKALYSALKQLKLPEACEKIETYLPLVKKDSFAFLQSTTINKDIKIGNKHGFFGWLARLFKTPKSVEIASCTIDLPHSPPLRRNVLSRSTSGEWKAKTSSRVFTLSGNHLLMSPPNPKTKATPVPEVGRSFTFGG